MCSMVLVRRYRRTILRVRGCIEVAKVDLLTIPCDEKVLRIYEQNGIYAVVAIGRARSAAGPRRKRRRGKILVDGRLVSVSTRVMRCARGYK